MRFQYLGAVEDDLDLLVELLRLHQRENLEHLVERAEAAWKNDERLRHVRKPELPHEEVVELKMEAVGDVGIWPLLEGQLDVEADRLATRLLRAPIRSFHDAWAATRRDDETMVGRSEAEGPFREQLRELSRLLVVSRPLHGLSAEGEVLFRLRGFASGEPTRQAFELGIRVLATADSR